ncbi:MAG: hypothetical protein AB7K71_20375 [Polyangiaceae bacterium]
MASKLSLEAIITVLAGASVVACNNNTDAKPEPAASAAVNNDKAPAPTAEATAAASVEAKEVGSAAPGSSASGKPMSCAPGKCGNGSCG